MEAKGLTIRRRHPHLITANCDQHARSRGVHPNVESENVVSGMFCDTNYLRQNRWFSRRASRR
jgi:hypothetical protein